MKIIIDANRQFTDESTNTIFLNKKTQFFVLGKVFQKIIKSILFILIWTYHAIYLSQ